MRKELQSAGRKAAEVADAAAKGPSRYWKDMYFAKKFGKVW